MGRPPKALSPTFWECFEQFPPIIVRLSARFPISVRHVRALSHREIAIGANMPLSRVFEISQSFSWDGITMSEAKRFCIACSFDPTRSKDRNRQFLYVRSCLTNRPNQFPHYLRSSPWWKEEFLPLIHLLKSRPKSWEDSRKSPSPEAMSAA